MIPQPDTCMVQWQVSSSSSENGLATPSEPVRLIIKIGIDESMPEPPSVFYAEQRNVKQKLSSLKAEKQQLQRQLSSLQETREEYSTELLSCPANLAHAKAETALLQHLHNELAQALRQSQQAESQVKGQLVQSEGRHASVTASFKQLQEAYDRQAAETAVLEAQLQAAVAKSDEVSRQLSKQQQAADASQQRHSELQPQLQASQGQVTALQQELQDLLQDSEQSAGTPNGSVQEQVQSGDAEREALQLQVRQLQEALATAQRLSNTPSPSGLTTPTTRTPSPAKDESALHGLRSVKAVLQSQLARMQQSAEGADAHQNDQQVLQEVEAAQTHVEQLEEHLMAWQVSDGFSLYGAKSEALCMACRCLLGGHAQCFVVRC